MGKLNNYLIEEATKIANENSLPWNYLKKRTIVITGGTGLVCSQLVRALLSRNSLHSLHANLVLPVRNIEKAQSMFGTRSDIQYVKWELESPLPEINGADFFVHGACSTSNKDFQMKPATIISQIVNGGKETLEFSLAKSVKKYVFLSTMEVYGEVDSQATEDNLGKLDPMIVRNSYPEAKRLVECLCASYYAEFKVPALTLRLAQTFGEGASRNDPRVFAEFSRDALDGNNIVMFSDGAKKNPYLSVNDATRAIIIALANGKPGEAYNVANEETYCSVKEMAEIVLKHFGSKTAKIIRKYDPKRAATFAKSPDLKLDTTKMKSIGWAPKDSLKDMYSSMIHGWNYEENN